MTQLIRSGFAKMFKWTRILGNIFSGSSPNMSLTSVLNGLASLLYYLILLRAETKGRHSQQVIKLNADFFQVNIINDHYFRIGIMKTLRFFFENNEILYLLKYRKYLRRYFEKFFYWIIQTFFNKNVIKFWYRNIESLVSCNFL